MWCLVIAWYMYNGYEFNEAAGWLFQYKDAILPVTHLSLPSLYIVMGITILVRQHSYIETTTWWQFLSSKNCSLYAFHWFCDGFYFWFDKYDVVCGSIYQMSILEALGSMDRSAPPLNPWILLNMLRLEQNDSPFADNILLGIFLNKNISISNKISFKISHTCRFLWVEFVKQ